MDDKVFDGLVRGMVGAASRRRVVRGLAALAAVALPGARAAAGVGRGPGTRPGRGPGDAPGRNRVGVCHRTASGKYRYLLLPKPAAEAHARQHGDAINVDLATDAKNCGACGVACSASAICQDGACCTPPTAAEICTDPCSCEKIPVQCGPDIDCGAFVCDTAGTGRLCFGGRSEGIRICGVSPGEGTAFICPPA